MKPFAIIDQGTNSSKLHIYGEDKDGSLREVRRESAETRLGDNLEQNDHKISDGALKQTLTALKRFREIAKEIGVDRIEAVSTEIMRKAANAPDACARIEEETGIRMKILSQEKEARVYWHGVTSDFSWDGKIAAIDIGGGSVQFMYGSKDNLEGHELIKTGTLFLRNKYIAQEPATEEEYANIENAIKQAVAHINYKLPSDTPFIHGSTSVFDFYREAGVRLEEFGYSKGHPVKNTLVETDRLYREMRLLSISERESYFPSRPDFTHGVAPGLANMLIFGEKIGLSHELPSNANILTGLSLLMREGKYDTL